MNLFGAEKRRWIYFFDRFSEFLFDDRGFWLWLWFRFRLNGFGVGVVVVVVVVGIGNDDAFLFRFVVVGGLEGENIENR
jgi:hypothetical protein